MEVIVFLRYVISSPFFYYQSYLPIHLQVLLRTRRLGQFGQEVAHRQDTPLWLDAESGMYSFSLDRIVTEEKDKNKKNDLVRQRT